MSLNLPYYLYLLISMNILFEYLYRDAGNFKNWGEVIFSNKSNIPLAEIETEIRTNLIDGQFFVAEEVGVPTLYFDERTEDDHGWHEFDGVEETNRTGGIEITEFLNSLHRVSKK